MADPNASARDSTPPRKRRRWVLRATLVTGAFLVALIGGGYSFLAGQSGIDLVVRELVARSGGALAIDGATGSLFDTVRIRRITWQGPDTQASAHEVALTWNPLALLSRGIVVDGLGAQRLVLETNVATGDVPLPASTALPIEVRIERLGIGELDWRVGASRDTIRGIAFGYAGGAQGHRISDATFVAGQGAIAGNATLGASAPFAIAGRLKAKGDAGLKGTDADIVLGGSLAELAIDATGTRGTARFTGRALLAPLAAVSLREATLDASGIDLAHFHPALPATELQVTLRARPDGGALAGTIEAANVTIGSIDAGRAPLRTLSARFVWRDDTLSFDAMAATLDGGGAISGQGNIPLGTAGGGGSWALLLRDIDLKRIYAPMVATRLSGRINADLGRAEQRIRGDISDRTQQGGIALDFSAVVTAEAVVVQRFRARSGKGELAGRGRVAFEGERPFDLDATALRFDPAAYGAFPAGALDGRIAAKGTLAPAWRVHTDIALAQGSRLAGVAVAGTARGTLTRDAVRDAVIDLSAGRARLTVTGSVGGGGTMGKGDSAERVGITLDAPNLAELAPLLPPSLLRSLAGTLHAKAILTGLPPRGGIELDVDGSQLVTPIGNFATLHASLKGTTAEHAVTLALKNDDFDVTLSAHGALDMPPGAGGGAAWAAAAWKGTLDALENRGTWALRLAAPATIEAARTRIRVGATRLSVADGNVRLADFAWDDGRIATSGSFAGVPLATVARLSGRTLPLLSTVTLGGEWALSASPRLSGTLAVRRESGDVFFLRNATSDSTIAAGISALDALARFNDDALDATATFRSTRGDKADAKVSVGTIAGAPPGRIAPEAPLEFTASGDIPSLQFLQPWIGSAAVVSGRMHFDVAARGTVANAALSGAVVGEGLRIDAPQYGLHFTNGRIKARAANDRIDIDELTLGAGSGTFRASGAISGLALGGEKPVAKLAWKADRFRAFNRPDLHLVVGGEGTVLAENGRITLSGKLIADEGTIVYLATPDSTLGDDVVVKGWTRPATDRLRVDDLPLVVDLTLDLGNRLMFSGEGIDTRLAGAVRVTSGPNGLVGRGSIRTVRGTYLAFGQQLTIERGQLVFDGRLDNPGLDIVALRKNLAVEAGVTVTGTVKVPVIQLTSNPPVPDSEKLSWLVLGTGTDRTGGGDMAALQAASAALLGAHGKPISASIAQSVGLDNITFKTAERTAPTGTPGAANQVVAVGKRLSDRLSLVYEQGLTIATNALRLEYELTRSLTLRAEAGTVGALGIYFRRTFD